MERLLHRSERVDDTESGRERESESERVLRERVSSVSREYRDTVPREGERECVCVCVCVSTERQYRKRVCVCVCVSACVFFARLLLCCPVAVECRRLGEIFDSFVFCLVFVKETFFAYSERPVEHVVFF